VFYIKTESKKYIASRARAILKGVLKTGLTFHDDFQSLGLADDPTQKSVTRGGFGDGDTG
jgi:hypothetical protein